MSRRERKRRKQSITEDEPQASLSHTELEPLQLVESAVDEVTLKSLTIQREYLDELVKTLPKPPETELTHKRVFVRKLRPMSEPSERPPSKSVKVARPLPPGYVPSQTVTSLGHLPAPLDWKPGPRYADDGQLIPHSILGTEEEFTREAEAVASHVQIQFPERESVKETRVRKTWFDNLPRQENALKHWQQRMKDRCVQQDYISSRVDRSAGHLVMNQSDNYVDRQTIRTLIDRAAPYLEDGRGYRVGSEFWNQQERLGDYETGIRMSLTTTERGQPPQVQLVGRPDVTKFETGTEFSDTHNPSTYPWKQSRYLSTRLQHFEPILNEMNPLDPELSSLYVVGQGPRAKREEVIQLGSAGNTPESSEDEETDELVERHVPLVIHSPTLLIQEAYSLTLGVRDPIHLRLLMEGNTGQLVRSTVTLENRGTSVVYADWKKLPKFNKLHRVLEGNTQRFYFDLREKVLLPGHVISVPVIFKSAQAGVYWESWELATRPSLQPLIVTFRGIAVMNDKFFLARQQVEKEIAATEGEVSVKQIVEDILYSIATPPRTPTRYRIDRTHEEKFTRVNPGVEFRDDLFRALQTLYISSFNPPTLSDRADSVEVRKEGKASVKKEENKGKPAGKPAKKGEKVEKKDESSLSKLTILPVQQEFIVLSHEKIQECLEDIPEWDLTLEALTTAILSSKGSEQQIDLLLAQFNEVLSRFHSPLLSAELNSNYQLMYMSLLQVLEQIPYNSAKLRAFYNLPEKLFIDETQPELGEAVTSPTDLSRKKKVPSKQDLAKKPPVKKGATKEDTPSKPKGSTPSRKGKTSVASRTQDSVTEVTPDLPKTAEIDPAVEKVYSLQLRQVICDLFDTAVSNFLTSVCV